MSAEFRQIQKQEQTLALTPQLKRSLEILQAASLDLVKIIDAELKNNPMLEETDYDEFAERPETLGGTPEEDAEDYGESNHNFDKEQKNRDFFLNSLPDKKSLQEHLIIEAELDAKNERIAKAFVNLIGSLDERGFLLPDAIDTARAAGFDKKTIDEAVSLLRNCDPPGIGAFDMRDSLMLQLERKNLSAALPYRILESHYELLLKRKVEEIAEIEKDFQRTLEKCQEVTLENRKKGTFFLRLEGWLLKWLAPLM